jgi:hypothetical protein
MFVFKMFVFNQRTRRANPIEEEEANPMFARLRAFGIKSRANNV